MSARSFTLDKKRQGIITVNRDGQNLEVLLHGNKIVDVKGNEVTLSDCGWQTTTTKRAINRFLSQIAGKRSVYQKNFQWYFVNGETTTKFDGQVTFNLWG